MGVFANTFDEQMQNIKRRKEMIEGGAGLTSSESALRVALRGNQKTLWCISVMLDLARYS
jgi:hypothetical protein